MTDKKQTSRSETDLPKLAPKEESSKRFFLSPLVVTGLYRLFEFLLIFTLGLVIFYLYVYKNSPTTDTPLALLYISGCFILSLITCLALHGFNLYTVQSLTTLLKQIPRIILAATIAFVLFTTIFFLSKISTTFSRGWFLTWYVATLINIIGFRYSMSWLIHRWGQEGRLNRRAVIVGGGANAVHLIKALEAEEETDIRITGIFDDRSDDRVSPVIEGYNKLGNYDELVEFGRNKRIDILIVTLPLIAEDRILEILKKLWVLPVDIRLAAHTSKLRFRPRAYSYIGKVPFIDVFDRPLADWDFVLKWIFDKVIATLALIALSPVMLITALAIKLDSKGPVFFKQKRYGFNNELIEVYKFRSMYTDKSDADASKLVTKGDPRVTKVGRFIRKTSIDELPQLFNVLIGNLSLVGPRPHAMQAKAAQQFYQDVVDGYFARHRMKPGITGWAQINGWRGETDTEEKIQQRVNHDLYYIENWSLFLDIYILAKTPMSLIFENENAY